MRIAHHAHHCMPNSIWHAFCHMRVEILLKGPGYAKHMKILGVFKVKFIFQEKII